MGLIFKVCSVILIVGIFLVGKIYIGLDNYEGGWVGDFVVIILV